MLIRYPRRVTINNKRLISKRKKSEKPEDQWSCKRSPDILAK